MTESSHDLDFNEESADAVDYGATTPLTTERLTLRLLDTTDGIPLQAVLGDPDVMKFSDDGPLDNAKIDGWLKQQKQQYETSGHPVMAVTDRESGEVIGYCGLFDCVIDEVSEVEVGFRFSSANWGKGYATEAAAVMLDYAHRNLGLNRVVAMIDPGNEGSQRVAEKLGMAYEKDFMMPGYSYPDRLYVSKRSAS